MANTFFIADTHFNHSNIIKYCNRSFVSSEDQTSKLIENWNSVVKDEDDDRKAIDYEMMSSICKSLKVKQLKLLHKHIIDVADELYRFSDELDMSDNEEHICKISIIESIKELNNVAEYLTKRTLGDTNEAPK